MKRFTFLFALLTLLASISTTKAQTPTATPITDAEVPTGYYFIASTADAAYDITSPYIAANGNEAMKLVAQTAVTTDVSNSKVGLWYIQKTGTTSNNKASYSIKSVDVSAYWTSGVACPLGSGAGVYNIVQADDQSGYYFSGNGGGINNNAYVNATSATAFERNNSGSYNKWKLIPAGVKDVTLAYTAGSHTFKFTQLRAIGEQISTAVDFYKDITPATVTVTADADTYAVNATANFPFVEGKWYKVKLRWKNPNDNKNQEADGVYTYRSLTWDGVWNSHINTRDVVTESNYALWSFKLKEGTANQVYMCNAINNGNAYVRIDGTTNNGKAYMSPIGTAFICKKGNTGDGYTNGFRLQDLNEENANLNDVSGELGCWNNGGSKTDQGSTFTLYEPEANPEVVAFNTIVATNSNTSESLTFNNANETIITTKAGNDKFIASSNSFFQIESRSCDAENHTLTINYTSTAPYTLSSNDTKHWMVIRSRYDSNTDRYLKAKDDGKILSRDNSLDRTSLSAIRSFNEIDANKWAIIPADISFNTFYLVNKAYDGKKAYLSAQTQGTEVEMSSTKATAFYLQPQPTFDNITNGFTIQPDASNTHAVGDHGNGNLNYWCNRGSSELNDNGSIFRVADLLTDCKTIATNHTNTQYVGDIAAVANTTLGEQTSVEDFFTKYDELATAGTLYSAPAQDKLYRITFTRGNVSPALTNANASADGTINQGSGSTPDERRVTYVAQATTTPSAIVRFVPVSGEDGSYLIQDVNSQLYYGSKNTNSDGDGKLYAVKDSQWAGHYAVDNSINGTLTNVGIKNTKSTNITEQYLWCRGENESTILSNYNYVCFHSPYNGNAQTGNQNSIEAGCVVKIQEVTSFPLTISEAQYASLCLPFSVTLPEGVTANKVTAVTGDSKELTLESIGNTIPANEPVIVQGTAGSYTLTMNSTDGTKSNDNLLTGASVKRTGIADTYYALGYKAIGDATDKTAGFYKVSTGNMPANKAYLLKSNIPASAQAAMMFSFNFGGTTTDINHATTTQEAENNVYYDLNGRRVLYPSHGIYIKGNGKKVFIK